MDILIKKRFMRHFHLSKSLDLFIPIRVGVEKLMYLVVGTCEHIQILRFQKYELKVSVQ